MSSPPTENNNNTNIPSKDPTIIPPSTSNDVPDETVFNEEKVNSMNIWFTGKVMATPHTHPQSGPNVPTLSQGYPLMFPSCSMWNHTPLPPPSQNQGPNFHQYPKNVNPVGYPSGPQNQGPNFHQYPTNVNPAFPSGPWKHPAYPNLDFYPNKEEDLYDMIAEPHRPMDFPNIIKIPPVAKHSLTNLPNPNYSSPQRGMNYPNPGLYSPHNRMNFFDVPGAKQAPIDMPNLGYPPNPQMDYPNPILNPQYFRTAMNMLNPDYRRMDDPNHQYSCPSNCRRQVNFFDMNYPTGAKPDPGYPQWHMDYPNPCLCPPRQSNFFEMNRQGWDMPNPMDPLSRLPDAPTNYEPKYGFTQESPFYPNVPFQYPQRQMPPHTFQERTYPQLPQTYPKFQRTMQCRPDCPLYDHPPPFKFHYNASTSTDEMPQTGAAFDCSLFGKVYYKEKPKPMENDNNRRGLNLRSSDVAAALSTQGTQSYDARRLILPKPPQKAEKKDATDEQKVKETNYEESTSGDKSEKKVKRCKKRRCRKKKKCNDDDCSASSSTSDSGR